MSGEKNEVTLRLNPIARAILQGLYDTESPLHRLLGLHYILKIIWRNVIDHWKSKITTPVKPFLISHNPNNVMVRGETTFSMNFMKVQRHRNFVLKVEFPKPRGININMMPFVMDRDFKKTKLPKNLRGYWDQIIQHCIDKAEIGKIGYLTIQESYVDEGSSQRRPGIHTESPGLVMLRESKGCVSYNYFPWGAGQYLLRAWHDSKIEGGIYMASNVENSCKVWDCQILRPEVDSLDVVGKHGDIEHLREFLPSESEVMEANYIYWITDRTPHESLPLSTGTYRQFFRLVTSEVAGWFEDHSTKNPLGVVPDSKITKIIKGSKFEGVCCVFDP